MGKGQNEGFSEEQVEMYKECFKLMDIDKDGTISKNDLRAAFDNVGKLMTESELDDMLGEVGGSCNFDNMIKMFQTKMAGGSNDPDDLIVAAFKAYEEEDRKVSAEKFRWALTKWGDKFSAAEVDDIFGEFEIDDDGFLSGKAMCSLFVAGGGEEKKEEEKPAAADGDAGGDGAAAPEEGGDDGGKKKKKKKKAAK
jgi:Ca2+-binding EF-hand superfamily protein